MFIHYQLMFLRFLSYESRKGLSRIDFKAYFSKLMPLSLIVVCTDLLRFC